jgi:1,4-alpha-glucan branching enzyme
MSKKNHHKAKPVKKEQQFSVKAPQANNVQLVGSFSHWEQNPIPMKKENDGIWRAVVEMEPGEYPYRFLVDGQWQDDEACNLHIPNPFGTMNSVRQVS